MRDDGDDRLARGRHARIVAVVLPAQGLELDARDLERLWQDELHSAPARFWQFDCPCFFRGIDAVWFSC